MFYTVFVFQHGVLMLNQHYTMLQFQTTVVIIPKSSIPCHYNTVLQHHTVLQLATTTETAALNYPSPPHPLHHGF
jgi:hypothetical protein